MARIGLVLMNNPSYCQGHMYRMRALCESLEDLGHSCTYLLPSEEDKDIGPTSEPPPGYDHLVVDVPDARQPRGWANATRVAEDGTVTLQSRETLVGLSYAILRRGFRETRPDHPPLPVKTE